MRNFNLPAGIGRYFYHPDHLGSSSYITDASGEVYQHLEYFAFGETFVEEHSNTHRTPYLFNGKELDEETGLYYYGARFYDPITSIFPSVDPMTEMMPNWSPYAYAFNNPVRYSDPTGMVGEDTIDPPTGNKSDVYPGTTLQEATVTANKTDIRKGPTLGNGGNTKVNANIGSSQSSGDGSNSVGVGAGSSFAQSGGGKNTPGGEWDFWGKGSVTYDGEAMGGTNFIGPGPDRDPFKLGLQPIDAIDKAAQIHDYYYYKAMTGGVTGALLNKDVAGADLLLTMSAARLMINFWKGGTDEVTGLPISWRTYNLASAVFDAFAPITFRKLMPEIEVPNLPKPPIEFPKLRLW